MTPSQIPGEVLEWARKEKIHGAALASLQRQFTEEAQQLAKKLRTGDRVFFYREAKGSTGWYREGYVAIRGCEVIGEIVTLDEM